MKSHHIGSFHGESFSIILYATKEKVLPIWFQLFIHIIENLEKVKTEKVPKYIQYNPEEKDN
jgi:hypothetical protein